MADAVERTTKFRDSGLVLADDLVDFSARLRKNIRAGEFQRAEAIATALQTAARDVKWLMRRLPKKD